MFGKLDIALNKNINPLSIKTLFSAEKKVNSHEKIDPQLYNSTLS